MDLPSPTSVIPGLVGTSGASHRAQFSEYPVHA